MFAFPLVSFVSALTALIAAMAGPFVTLYVARAQMRISVLATNRQRWIDEFREQVAHLCSEVAIAGQIRDKIISNGRFVIQGEPEFLNSYGRLIYTANKIRLMVNPLDREHQDLLSAIDALLLQFQTSPDDIDLWAMGQALIGKSLSILRREWLLVQKGV